MKKRRCKGGYPCTAVSLDFKPIFVVSWETRETLYYPFNG